MDKFIRILSALFLMALQVILSKHYHDCLIYNYKTHFCMCTHGSMPNVLPGRKKSTTNIIESMEADWPLSTFKFHHVRNLCSANKNLAPTLSSLQFSSNILRLSSIHNTMYKWNNSFASTPAFIGLCEIQTYIRHDANTIIRLDLDLQLKKVTRYSS